MPGLDQYIQPALDPLRQQIASLEIRLKKTEETLARVIKSLPVQLVNEEESSATLQIASFSAQSGPYVYRPLDSAQSEIRILVIYPSLDDEDPIVCELLHASLNDQPHHSDSRSSQAISSFKTLSYTWGDVKTTKTITIEGHQFPVTQNLAVALNRIRRHSAEAAARMDTKPQPTFWWIDAICINQADVEDRSQQVNLMTRIYKKATGVHIWLGEDASNSERGMDLVRQLGISKQRGPGDPDIEYPTVTETERDENWQALTALMERPWWEHVWIRQEVAVAKEAVVHCGSQICPFSAFAVTADILNKIDEQLGFGPLQQARKRTTTLSSAGGTITNSPYLQAWVLAGFRLSDGLMPNVSYRDLAELLLHTRSCKATDLRDKVFSMLGLVDPEFWDLRADYRLSLNDALVSTARSIITKSRSLNVFAACQNPERRHGLPSWTPNLIDEWKARPLPKKVGKPNLGLVSAEEDSDFAFESDDENLLRAEGRRLDIVDRLTEDTPQEQWSDEELDALSTRWRQFVKHLEQNPEAHIFDAKFARDYPVKDASWLKFVSAATDLGNLRPVTSAPLTTKGNYQMVQSLLLPESPSSGTGDLPRRIRAALRKFGVGRRLGTTQMGRNKGTIVLVPEDTQVGDEIWAFRGTHSLYTMRKVKDRTYVVVGDAYGEMYFFLRPTDKNSTVETIWIT